MDVVVTVKVEAPSVSDAVRAVDASAGTIETYGVRIWGVSGKERPTSDEETEKWALLDISPVVQHGGEVNHVHTSWSASKVIGLYDSERDAWQASSDMWDCSGRQDFRVVNVGEPKHLKNERE